MSQFGSIGFVGVAGSGKTTAARYLAKKYGYTEMSFATPVKSIAEDVLVSIGQYGNRRKKVSYKDTPAGRQLLQLIGDGLGRELIGPPHIWIDALFERMRRKQARAFAKTLYYTVDDVRYENEAYALLGKGFTLVRLNRDPEMLEAFNKERYGENVTVLNHISEEAIDGIPVEFTIDFTDENVLFSTLDEIVDYLREDD